MGDICGDNRFEIIKKAKAELLKSTNIETSEDEMKVLDSFLFRCYQMGWLARYDDDVTVVYKCTIDTYLKGLHDFETLLGMVACMRRAQKEANDLIAQVECYEEAMEHVKKAEELESMVDKWLEGEAL